MSQSDKVFITANEHCLDSFRLAVQIYQSGFRPDYIIGVWRGGTPVAIAVHEAFAYWGARCDHIAVRASYEGMEYYSIDQQPQIQNTGYLTQRIGARDRLLIVDDVFATGRSLQAVIERLAQKLRFNMPTEIKTAVTYIKSGAQTTLNAPDFFIRQYDPWLVMPYELNGMSEAEIVENRKGLVPFKSAN